MGRAETQAGEIKWGIMGYNIVGGNRNPLTPFRAYFLTTPPREGGADSPPAPPLSVRLLSFPVHN